MHYDQFSNRYQSGEQGENDAEDRIDACDPTCYVRNPIVPGPDAHHPWLEKDFLVYIEQKYLFCIEVKNFAGRISYPQIFMSGRNTSFRVPQQYDYSRIMQEREGKDPRFIAHPLERTKEYITHLKRYLENIDPQLHNLPIIPVVAFSPRGDISAISDFRLGILYFTDLPDFFYHCSEPTDSLYPSSRIKQVLSRVPTWDKICLRTGDRWIKGMLVDRELTFLKSDGRWCHLPFAQILAVGLNNNGTPWSPDILTVKYMSGETEEFLYIDGAIQLTFKNEAQTYPLRMLSRIIVGIANKFL